MKLISMKELMKTSDIEKEQSFSIKISKRRSQINSHLLKKEYADRNFEITWYASNPKLPLTSIETEEVEVSVNSITKKSTAELKKCVENKKGFTLAQVAEMIRQARIQKDALRDMINLRLQNEDAESVAKFVFSKENMKEFPLAFGLLYKNIHGAFPTMTYIISEFHDGLKSGAYLPMIVEDKNKVETFLVGESNRSNQEFSIIEEKEIEDVFNKFIICPK